MTRPSLTLWAVLAAAFASGCGEEAPNPPIPQPPRATLTFPSPVMVDTRLPFEVTASGCEAVEAVDLYEAGAPVRRIAFNGNPTPGELLPEELDFRGRMAGTFTFTARAVCTDGRVGESQPAPVQFLPVAEVISLPNDEYVVPEVFWAEGKGATVSFLGCVGQPGGTPTLARVSRQGVLLRTLEAAPFPCSLQSVLSEEHPTTGKRWLFEPGVGVAAFDATLRVTASRSAKYGAMAVGADGHAIVWDQEASFEALKKLSHVNGADLWMTGYQPSGILTGAPFIRPDGVYLPIFASQIGSTNGTVRIEVLSYATNAPIKDHDLKTFSFPALTAPPIPPTAFNADGSALFIAHQAVPTHSNVFACSTQQGGCTGAQLFWSSPSLLGDVLLVAPFANDTHVAAVAAQQAWFLSNGSGQPVNPDGAAGNPTGALVANAVVAGKGLAASASNPGAACGETACEDFYVLYGPPPTQAQPTPLPLELVAYEHPDQPEVFRLALLAGSLNAAVDDAGALWLRVGPKLVRPLALPEYRRLLR